MMALATLPDLTYVAIERGDGRRQTSTDQGRHRHRLEPEGQTSWQTRWTREQEHGAASGHTMLGIAHDSSRKCASRGTATAQALDE